MNIPTRDINRVNSPINNDQYEILSNSSTRKTIEWSYENEEILAEWCDIAQCYKWLNTETYKYYKDINSYLTIPCIICSTVSGVVSFGIPSIPLEYQYIIPFFTGTFTIGVGIITTIQQYYRFSELKETHRILSIAWDKLARSIRIELSKAPMERIDARHFIKFTRIEFDRLMENSEIIPDTIIQKFNIKINNSETELEANTKRHKYSLKKPDICDTIVSINANRRLWFQQENEDDSLHYQENLRRKSKYRNRNRSISNFNTNYDEINEINENIKLNEGDTNNEIKDKYYHTDLKSLFNPTLSANKLYSYENAEPNVIYGGDISSCIVLDNLPL
jgi:hypothetical protein